MNQNTTNHWVWIKATITTKYQTNKMKPNSRWREYQVEFRVHPNQNRHGRLKIWQPRSVMWLWVYNSTTVNVCCTPATWKNGKNIFFCFVSMQVKVWLSVYQLGRCGAVELMLKVVKSKLHLIVLFGPWPAVVLLSQQSFGKPTGEMQTPCWNQKPDSVWSHVEDVLGSNLGHKKASVRKLTAGST